MKPFVVGLLAVCVVTVCVGQDDAEWQVMPGVTLVKYFRGSDIHQRSDMYMPTFPPMIYAGYDAFSYEGTGILFNARVFSDEIKPLALTFGGGVNWFYQPDSRGIAYPSAAPAGIGEIIGRRDFMTYPLSVGVQAIFPYESRKNLMFFGGLEMNVQFVSGDIAIARQTQVGYSVLGGFAVKIFEFGVRYTAFSDIRNLGAQVGLRFNSFGI